MTLDRNADNYFADVEQAAFDPGNFVPGIGPSPDKMLQGRLFAYGDAHRYRLGINHTQLPVNAPHAAQVRNYGRDGFMAGHGNGGRAKNYEPNSFDGPVETGRPLAAPLSCTARPAPTSGTHGRPTTSPRPVTSTGCSPPTPRIVWSPTSPGDWHRSRPAPSARGSSIAASGTSGPPILISASASPRSSRNVAPDVAETAQLPDRLIARDWRITPQRRAVSERSTGSMSI